MIKILSIPEAVPSKRGGQYTYCKNLQTLFANDEDIDYKVIDQPDGIVLPLINKLWFPWKKIFGQIKQSECDIIHINGYLGISTWQQFIGAMILKRKIVYSPHFHPFKFIRHPLFGRIFFFVFIFPLLLISKKIITIGISDHHYFRFFGKKVISIPHHFTFQPKNDINLKKKHNMILFVGRNEENKGLRYLYKLPSKYEVHCVTGGELERKDFIQHTRIPEEELSRLYSMASLVVIPSGYEAFSLVALEAFSHNTPVVMSSNVKIADYLDKEKGYSIFEYGNITDFLNKVETTIGNSVDSEIILSKFSPEKIKEIYKTIFKSI